MTSPGTTGPQPGSPRTRRTRTRTATRKENPVNLYDPAAAVIVQPLITGTHARPPATLSESALTAAGILAAADAAGLPAPSSITIYGFSPEINILISGDTPAEVRANLETWATRHGTRDISVQPSVGDANRAYASTEFTATGIRVCLCAIIRNDPGNTTDTGTESAATPPAAPDDSTGTQDTSL